MSQCSNKGYLFVPIASIMLSITSRPSKKEILTILHAQTELSKRRKISRHQRSTIGTKLGLQRHRWKSRTLTNRLALTIHQTVGPCLY